MNFHTRRQINGTRRARRQRYRRGCDGNGICAKGRDRETDAARVVVGRRRTVVVAHQSVVLLVFVGIGFATLLRISFSAALSSNHSILIHI